jgi:hypothetical protein
MFVYDAAYVKPNSRAISATEDAAWRGTGTAILGAAFSDGPLGRSTLRRSATMARRLPIAILAAAVLALAAGCGGSGSDEASTTATVPGGADPGDVKVIGAWVDALRSGNSEAAANYFALPSVAQNGTGPIKLDSASEILAFNQSLPCGAKLVSATTEGQVTTATFELTDRPGGDCGDGVGLEAMTAFVIADGKIVHWSRVPGPDDGPQVPGTSTGQSI